MGCRKARKDAAQDAEQLETASDVGTAAATDGCPAPDKKPTGGSSAPQPSLAISYYDAMETLRHDRNMTRALVGVPLPVVYFCLFVAMLSIHIPTSALYEQAISVSSVLDSSGTDAITAATAMKFQNIQAASDVFDWLTNTLVPSVFVTEDYNGDTLTSDKWGRIASYNKVLGAVKFQTTKAATHKCQAAQFLVDLYPYCYDPNHTDERTLLISFDTNSTEAAVEIAKLKANGTWLDFSTKQLLITIVAYNGEVQGYTVSKLQLDFHQGGYIETTATTTPTISDPYKSSAALALDVLVAVCVVLSLLGPFVRLLLVLRAPRTWQKALMECDYATELVGLAPSALTITFYGIWIAMCRLMYAKTFRDNLARLVVSGKTFDANSTERDGLIAVTNSLEKVAAMTTALKLVAMATVFALGIDILMQFRFHPRLNIFTRTLAHALRQFGGFSVVFLVIFMTFSVSGTVLFGDRVESFSTISHTMESCVNMLFGNFDYSTIRDLQAPVGMLYYWAYMVVVCLVLLNMMLAIVLDSYAEMSREAAASKYNLSLRRTVRNVLYDCERRLARHRYARKVRAAAHYQDANELRGEILSNGRIAPTVLERVLLVNRPRGSDPKQVMITETTLRDWFPEAKLSAHDTQRTIRFLLEGCVDDTGTQQMEIAATVSVENPIVCEPSSNLSRVAPFTEMIPVDAATELARVLGRMEALERKLDQLLAARPGGTA